MKLQLPERRRFIRIEVPLKLRVKSETRTVEVVTKNISPIGMRFEVPHELNKAEKLELTVFVPSPNSTVGVRLTGRVVWQTRTSLEDNAPYDVGVEIIEIEDANKNFFLKYLCDLLYESSFKARS